MTFVAPAKINLGLQILRKRPDGYHDIDTVFHRVEPHDTLTIVRRERGVTMACDDPTLRADEGNLCVRAARALFDATGYDGGVHIDLQKRIPTGAGLGGGSSDAAAVLRALPEMLGIPIAEQDLHAIAAGLGSDIPYFLHPGCAAAKGRGELLQYFPLEVPYWIVIVYPAVHVSTAWAYGRFQFNPALPVIDIRALLIDHIRDPHTLVNKLRNDFEPIVFREHEDVMRAKEILYRTGAAFALMSGSGSSVFGLFDREDEARECAGFFQRTYRVFLTPPARA